MSDQSAIKGVETRDVPPAPPTEKRYTLRLSQEAADTMDWIARERGGVSHAEVIRRALGTERFLLEQMRNGTSIVLETPGRRPRELVLR